MLKQKQNKLNVLDRVNEIIARHNVVLTAIKGYIKHNKNKVKELKSKNAEKVFMDIEGIKVRGYVSEEKDKNGKPIVYLDKIVDKKKR